MLLILLWLLVVIFFLRKNLLGVSVFLPVLPISLVLPPVQASDVCTDCNGNGTKDREDDREDDIADAVVGLVRVVDLSDAREEDVEV